MLLSVFSGCLGVVLILFTRYKKSGRPIICAQEKSGLDLELSWDELLLQLAA